MPAAISSAQLECIIRIIEAYPDGASLQQIAQCLSPRPSDRTVLRLVDALIAQTAIEATGAARARRYRIRRPPAVATTESAETPSDEASRSAASRPSPRVTGVTGSKATAASSEGRVTDEVAGASRVSDNAGGEVADADFALMFEALMPQMVAVGASARGINPILLSQAAKNGKIGPMAQAYFAYATRRFEALTAEDVIGYGISAEKFAAWRLRYPGRR